MLALRQSASERPGPHAHLAPHAVGRVRGQRSGSSCGCISAGIHFHLLGPRTRSRTSQAGRAPRLRECEARLQARSEVPGGGHRGPLDASPRADTLADGGASLTGREQRAIEERWRRQRSPGGSACGSPSEGAGWAGCTQRDETLRRRLDRRTTDWQRLCPRVGPLCRAACAAVKRWQHPLEGTGLEGGRAHARP